MRDTVITAMLLAVMVLAVVCGAAEEPTPPVVFVYNDGLETIWAEKLGLDSPLKGINLKKRYDNYTDLLTDYKPDFYSIDTFSVNLQELLQAGMLEPFEPTETMLAEIASFPVYVQQLIRESLMTSDGKLLGYPSTGSGILGDPKFIGYWIPDAWEASPFKDINPPTCYEELLDFIEVYLNTPHDGFRLYYCTSGSRSAFIWDLFVYPLMDSWVIQSENAGKPLTFSDPKFIALVEKAQRLIPRLVKEDYRAKVNTKMRYLLADRRSRGYSYNLKDTFIMTNMIPLRVTADQPPLFNVEMTLNCVMAGSNWATWARELFTVMPEERSLTIRGVTYYDEFAFPGLYDVEGSNKDIDQLKAPKYRKYTQAWVDSIQDLDQSIVPCMLPGLWQPDSQYSESMHAIKLAFIERTMKPEEFAAEMDRINAARISGSWDKDIWVEDMGD